VQVAKHLLEAQFVEELSPREVLGVIFANRERA
jgi:hypothetical protein